MQWPQRFYDLKRGEGCPLCVAERADETPDGIRGNSVRLPEAIAGIP